MGKTFLEWVPSSVRWLIKPALFGSVGLHLLLLLMPLPQRPSAPDLLTQAESTQIRLTDLPKTLPKQPPPTPKPTALKAATPSKPSPSITPQQRSAARPTLPIQPTLQRSLPSVNSETLPRPIAKPIVPAPASAPPSPEPIASPDPVPPPSIPFADIPLVAGAQTGCFGLGTCHQVVGTNFRTTGQTLEGQLKAQGYTIKSRDDLEETGREVYEISKNQETRYLNVLSSDLGSTIYLVTTQPITLDNLQNSETLKSELATILNSFPGTTTASPTQIAQPDAFFAGPAPRPEAETGLHLVPGNSPAQLLNSLETQLHSQSFTLTEAGGYGGGRLYEVTKDAFTGYLSLVPTTDRSSTIVVLWTNLPS